MTDQVISIAMIEAKAEAAFARGAGRDDHGFNWHAPAIAHYQAAWDRCAAAKYSIELAETSPP